MSSGVVSLIFWFISLPGYSSEAFGETIAGVGTNCSSDEGEEINPSAHLSISSTIRVDKEMQRALPSTFIAIFSGGEYSE